jgi:hypothetical protein
MDGLICKPEDLPGNLIGRMLSAEFRVSRQGVGRGFFMPLVPARLRAAYSFVLYCEMKRGLALFAPDIAEGRLSPPTILLGWSPKRQARRISPSLAHAGGGTILPCRAMHK